MYDLYIDIFTDGFSGILLGILVWVLSLILVLIVVSGILYIIDYSFRPTQETLGTIVHKEFIPEHIVTTSEYNVALKMPMPKTTKYEDEWVIKIEVDGLTDDVSVSQDYYNKCSLNQKIKVEYSNGRIWDSLYIKEIY